MQEKVFGRTKTVAISISIAVAAGGLLASEAMSATGVALDYLAPPESTRSPYDREVQSRFYVTPFNCGRYFEDTNFSVSVYLSNQAGEATVTTVASSQDLLNVPAAKHGSIAYKRVDRRIPKSTALLLRDVWRLMLQRRFLTKREEANTGAVTLDDFTGQFSLQLDDGRVLRGDLPIGSKFWGVHVRGFWDLANLLFKYCKTEDSADKAVTLKRIEQKATALRSTL